jgi:hypothetical protein
MSSGDMFERLGASVSGRYDVMELVGRGGMGIVFLANERSLDRPVAIKVLPTELAHDEKFVQRFEHEARTAAKLDHPNIIPIYAVESDDDLHYFVMKFVTGRALDEIIESGPLPIDNTQRILWEAACALGHAHTRGIVHRDIKPANIMIDDAGRTMLTDFGISKALQSASQFTATGQVIGTPHYMSPEQAKGQEVDGRSDQYSLAVVGYRMLAGRLPFEDESVHTIIYKHIFEEPPALSGMRQDAPQHVVEALHRALAKDPNDRFGTMEEFATAVLPTHPVTSSMSSAPVITSGAAIDVATEITPMPPTGPQPVPRKRRGMGVLLTIVALAGGAGGVYWVMSGGGAPGAEVGEPQAPVAAAVEDTTAAVTPLDTATAEDTATQVAQTPAPVVQEPEPQTQPPRQTETQRRPAQRPAAPQVGWVTIDANPFGTVWIDGVQIGDTPLVRHELRPGTYVIEVRREGYRTAVDTVRLTASNTVLRRYPLTREEP